MPRVRYPEPPISKDAAPDRSWHWREIEVWNRLTEDERRWLKARPSLRPSDFAEARDAHAALHPIELTEGPSDEGTEATS